MIERRLEGLDLNLLLALHWLLKEQNVTVAASRLGTSQPAASRALGRLREIFDDPLLIKTGNGMMATRLGTHLQPIVAGAIERCRDVLRVSDDFRPADHKGRFRVACADYMGVLVSDTFARDIHPLAPGMALDLIHPTVENAQDLVTGDVDLCILPDPHELSLPPSIDQEQYVRKPIMEQHYMTGMRADHPLAGEPLTMDQFIELDHILVAPEGKEFGVVDAALAERGLNRRIAYRLSSFLLVLSILKRTDCVVTAPHPLLRMLTGQFVAHPPPLPVRGMTMYAVWHPNWTQDNRHRWLREKLFEGIQQAEIDCIINLTENGIAQAMA